MNPQGVHRSTRELEEAFARYVEATDAHGKSFVWTKTADSVLPSPRRLGPRTSNSGHGLVVSQ